LMSFTCHDSLDLFSAKVRKKQKIATPREASHANFGCNLLNVFGLVHRFTTFFATFVTL
jgi:hypothetical protein